MSRYLYALMPGDAAPERLGELRGVTDGPVEASRAGPHLIVHGPHDGSEILQTRRRMLAHTRVLETLMRAGTVLPMRFGLVADATRATDAVLAQSDRIAAQFARLTGRVELGLRLSWPREAALARLLEVEPALAAARDRLIGRGAEAHFERIELGRRVAEALERRRTATQHALLPTLAAAVEDHVLKAPEEDVEVLRVECLVPENAQESLVATFAAAADRADFAPGAEPQLRVVGPVPPFHFVDLSLAPGAEAA